MERNTITIEQEGYEAEIPELDARMLIQEFLEEFEENLKQKEKRNRDRCNDLERIAKDSDLLNKEEMTEIIGENREEAGKSTGLQKACTLAWKTATQFLDDI